MATNTDEALRQMFRGWDSIETWKDSTRDEAKVLLTVSHRRLASFFNPGDMLDALWPRPVRLLFNGVRFHGRIVGRRK